MCYIDYCNGLMYGLPDNQLQQLQVIQNAAARLVTRTKKFESISPILRALHWLPIRSRIAFKILLLTYKCFHETAPSYLSELLVRYEPGRSLRSSHRDLYVVPPSQLIFMVNGVSGMPPQNYGMTSRII